jgi:hypothetical protein
MLTVSKTTIGINLALETDSAFDVLAYVRSRAEEAGLKAPMTWTRDVMDDGRDEFAIYEVVEQESPPFTNWVSIHITYEEEADADFTYERVIHYAKRAFEDIEADLIEPFYIERLPNEHDIEFVVIGHEADSEPANSVPGKWW